MWRSRHFSRKPSESLMVLQLRKTLLRARGIMRNRTLLDMVRSMMNLTTLSLSFWDYTLESATRILNMVLTKKVDKTPYELCKIAMKVEGFKPPQEEVILIRRSERTHQAPNRLCLNVEVEEHSLGDLDEPASYKAAMLDSESNKDRSKRLIGLGQNAYMDKILKRYKMDNSKRDHIPKQERLDLNKTQGTSTPKEVKRMQNVPYASAVGSIILDLNKTQGTSTPKEVKRMQNVPYASAVGSIMYAVRCTRPDVAFAQNIKSQFQQNPGECHWTAVKNILKYLRNTKNMFLVYGENSKAKLQVVCYCDAGFDTDRDDTKSQT
nr:hypothetical protein [Tanacetum cinerariifolium]